jgi:hypothetical protein
MRRLLLALTILFVPLIAAGQSLAGDTHDLANRLLTQKPDQFAQVGQGVAVPLWRGSDGRWLAIKADSNNFSAAQRNDAPLQYSVVDAASAISTDLSYGLGSNLQAHVGVSEHSWVNNRAPRVIGSEVGATYSTGRYSLGLSVGANSSTANSVVLPRVLPGAAPVVNGLPGFDSSAQFNARGRVALDSKSGIDLGASVGRVRLLPGNLLGINMLDQKALSFGVDRGPLSGSVVGRMMQPTAGIPGSGLNAERRWSSIDLGVTWHLPWQGELSIGAQNVWSSGNAVNTPAGPEPDQSRTPYVQYHQDL